MLVAVLADTHIPKRAKDLPAKAYQLLDTADAIIHAGDVIEPELLERLKKIAPTYAVQGNNDHFKLPESQEIELEGVRIGIIHDSGDRKGRGARMKRKFPLSQVVVFGHSHIPMNETFEDLLLFNPGSPTDRRRQPNHTMGLLHIENGRVDAQIVVID